MKTTKKSKGYKSKGIYDTVKCIFVFFLIVLLGSMLLTTFMLSGLISESNLEWYVIALLVLSSLLGALLINNEDKQNVIRIVAYIMGVLVMVSLLNVGLFGGEFSNALWKVIAIVVGTVAVFVKKWGGERKKRKCVLYKTHNR